MVRQKKTFPPGTFIPGPQRILAILQLCLTFSAVLWYSFQPFMGEYFSLKSRMLVYEYAKGTSSLLKSDEQKETLRRNAERFAALPALEKESVELDYERLLHYSTRPLPIKLYDGAKALLFDVHPFKLAWIVFATLVSIFLLMKREGGASAAKLLPILALFYGIDNQINGLKPYVSPDLDLFPSEYVIVNEYMTEPLSSIVATQREQLRKGWEQYLLVNWGMRNGQLTNEEVGLSEQIEQAEFNFTLARIKAIHGEPLRNWKASFREKTSTLIPVAYFIWNLFFAWMINRSVRRYKIISTQRTDPLHQNLLAEHQ
jgi:hypothetical protein